jgi:hypothetical protein
MRLRLRRVSADLGYAGSEHTLSFFLFTRTKRLAEKTSSITGEVNYDPIIVDRPLLFSLLEKGDFDDHYILDRELPVGLLLSRLL